jgi:O-acetyl-ADP-ribose deacetylase (regulator of RNase III)
MGARVFIASSTQAKPLMDQIAGWLKEWGLSPLPWDKVGLFRPGDYILERLLQFSGEVDAAVIIFGDEDRQWYHADAQPQPRDNVLIEYGIFASRLGRDRTIVCRTGRPKTASDLGGLVFVQIGKRNGTIDARKRLKDWALALPDLVSRAREREAQRQQDANAPLPSRVDAVFLFPDRTRRLEIVTGSLRDIRDVDVIVSSDNTDLQPSRIDERSMSGTLRYLDAERNPADLHVTRDAYVEALDAAKLREAVRLPTRPGAVIPAPTTGLRQQGVKYVFHAAVVQGMVETGYRATPDTIDETVRNCFRRFSDLAANEPLTSILFPVFGVGAGQLSVDAAVRRLLDTIVGGMPANSPARRVVVFVFVEPHRRVVNDRAEAMGLERVD